MHIFHKWSKWQLYENTYSTAYWNGETYRHVDVRQIRMCLVCGYSKDRLLASNVTLAEIKARDAEG